MVTRPRPRRVLRRSLWTFPKLNLVGAPLSPKLVLGETCPFLGHSQALQSPMYPTQHDEAVAYSPGPALHASRRRSK